MSNIGQNIKNRRLELGFTADQLANCLQKSRATIYRYESTDADNMPIGILEPLAKALSTTPAELMGWGGGAVKTTTKMTFDDNSPMHALTQAYLRRPSLVQDEIIRRLEELDATFSNKVSKLLQASGDINGFMQGTGLPFATVGKFMQGETVLTTPAEAERIATYFHTNVVDLFFGTDMQLHTQDVQSNEKYPDFHTENLSPAIARLLEKEISLSMSAGGNFPRVLIGLTNHLNSEVEKPTYQKTKQALDIIKRPDFADILERTIAQFNDQYPCATDSNTLSAKIANVVYDKQLDYLTMYSRMNATPVENLVKHLAYILHLN